MKTNRIVQVEIPVDAHLACLPTLERSLANPERLAAQIAEANLPENIAALYERLATYRRHRLAAEAEYEATVGGVR